MNKSLKPSIFKTSLLTMLLTSAFSAQAAGLGKLSVYSGIGQQLKAEVALTASPAELGSMTAKLASHEAFREAGIEYMSLLSDVRISVDKNAAGQPVLTLTTVRPISEPFLHFLVELSWTSGRLVREYTFLLDPPELLQVAKPASVVSPAAPMAKPLPAASAPAQTKPAVTVAKPLAESDYQVKPGDTLSKIANATRPESVTLDQMLVALFNGNQDAFAGKNMNRLRAGKILRVPSAEEASKVDSAEARKLVISHVGEFNAYRNRLAGAVTEAPAADTAPKQQVSGMIKPQVEDKAPASAAKDKLEVSRTEPVKAATKSATGSSLEEDLIARDKALREASERIVQLEKNIENLKQLVEVKSQTGVKLQQDSESAQPKPVVKAAEPTPAASPATTPATAATPEPAKVAEEARPAPVAEPVKPPPPAAAAKKPVAPPPPPLPEPSFIDDNPEIVYGGGGLIALLLGYLGYSSWRRKKLQAEEFAAEERDFVAVPETPEVKPATAGATAAAFDAGDISIQGEFSEGGLLTNEEIVDPVAEADVLMAYGRDRQAEEILQEGLNKDPSRSAIHMKLLELYAKQENIAQFETVAEKLHALNNGRGADWDKTLAVARTLGLSGGVFGAAATVAEAIKPAADSVEPSVTVESVQAEDVSGDVMLPPVAEIAEAPAVEETPSLEFDLDLGTSAGANVAAAVTAAEEAVATPPAEEEMSLDFDFDLGTPEAKEAVEAIVDNAVTPEGINPSEMDFDLDLGSPVEPSAAAAAVQSGEAALAELAGLAPEEAPIAGGLSDLKLDFDLELDQGPAETAATKPLAGAAVETTDLVLDFPGESSEAATQSVAKPDNPEVATKLELAQAYEEMGDLEGARELLNEVVSEGSESQQAQARAKLDQLSA
ncbi:MAG: FimV/HubP family polar landmark protein [Pseudomonadota bacterium]